MEAACRKLHPATVKLRGEVGIYDGVNVSCQTQERTSDALLTRGGGGELRGLGDQRPGAKKQSSIS